MAWFPREPLLPRPARILWVCSTSLSSVYVDSAVCQPKMVHYQSHQQHRYSQCLQIIYGTQKTPKKLLKKTWKQCRDGGWLTEVPVLLWWWAWILTQIDTGSPFPRGESPPRPEILPLWIIPPGRTKRQFCSDLWNDQHHISPMLLADRHHWLVPSPKDQSNPCVPTRKENSSLLRYLILYSLSCRLVPMEIRDTSSTRY